MEEQRRPAQKRDVDCESAKIREVVLKSLAGTFRKHWDEHLQAEVPPHLAPLIERLDDVPASAGSLVVIVTRNAEEWQDAVTVLREYGLRAVLKDDGEVALSLLSSAARRVKLFMADIHPAGDDDGIELACAVRQRWPWIRTAVASAFPERWLGVPAGVILVRKPLLPLDVVRQVDASCCPPR